MEDTRKTSADELMPSRKTLLSTLWIFILFNIFSADFHTLITPGNLEEIMSGVAGGLRVTEQLLLIAALVHEIPVAMMLLSRVLKRKFNRWANIIAGSLYLFFTVSDGPTDLDHLFFRTVMAVGLLLIIWFAWKWPKNLV